MRVLVETANMAPGEWLKPEYRRDGIGGSDAAAIANANKYKSPLVLYMEKVGIFEQIVDNEAAFWGNELEDIVARNFIKRYNQELWDLQMLENANLDPSIEQEIKQARIQRRNAILVHDEYEFMRANIDRLLMCPFKGKGILEVKTASQYLADEWKGDDVPDAYFIQVQHYLAITDFEYAYIAVLIGGQKLKYYYIPRDQEFIDSLIQLEKTFWYDHVKAEIPPTVDGSDSTKEMYKLLYPTSYEAKPALELKSEAIEWAVNTENAKAQIKAWTTTKQEYENKLKDAMQTADTANAGKHKITWKTASNGVRAMKIKLGE
jgi:predicted phage-related endonuclease